MRRIIDDSTRESMEALPRGKLNCATGVSPDRWSYGQAGSLLESCVTGQDGKCCKKSFSDFVSKQLGFVVEPTFAFLQVLGEIGGTLKGEHQITRCEFPIAIPIALSPA